MSIHIERHEISRVLHISGLEGFHPMGALAAVAGTTATTITVLHEDDLDAHHEFTDMPFTEFVDQNDTAIAANRDDTITALNALFDFDEPAHSAAVIAAGGGGGGGGGMGALLVMRVDDLSQSNWSWEDVSADMYNDLVTDSAVISRTAGNASINIHETGYYEIHYHGNVEGISGQDQGCEGWLRKGNGIMIGGTKMSAYSQGGQNRLAFSATTITYMTAGETIRWKLYKVGGSTDMKLDNAYLSVRKVG